MNLNSSNRNTSGPVSSLLYKLTHEQRRILDRAILNRQLPSCRALYEHHQLAKLGISYHAFWRYARRVRKDACKNLMLDPTLADQIDLPEKLPDVIGAHFLQMLMHDNPNAVDVSRMADTFQRALQFRNIHRRRPPDIAALVASLMPAPSPPFAIGNSASPPATTIRDPDTLDCLVGG